MMNVGKTTKAWSDAPQQSGLKSDGTRFSSASEATKLPQDKDVGQILNQIADPNYVDPAKMRRVGNSNLDKDAFFKLMLAQIKAQDPTNPMQSHEMAAQLAQFTSLEQLYNINSGIEGLAKNQDPSANFQVLNFLGKTVAADSSKIYRVKGDKTHEIRFNVMGDGVNSANVEVLDSTNRVVKSMKLGALKKGENNLVWNGLTEDGTASRAGEYRLRIEAKDNNGKKVAVQTSFSGKVSGVNFTPAGPVLMVGSQSIRLSEINKIEDEALKAQAAAAPGGAPAPGAAAAAIPGAVPAAGPLPADLLKQLVPPSAPAPAAAAPASPAARPQTAAAMTPAQAPQQAKSQSLDSIPAAEDEIQNDMKSVNIDPQAIASQMASSPINGPSPLDGGSI